MSDDPTMRDRIQESIRRFPGIHLRGLVKEVGTSTALARYHIQALESDNIIRTVEVGGFVRYFPRDTYRELSPKERAMLGVLRQDRPLEIVLALLDLGPMQHRDLLDIVGGSKGTLSYQLEKLIEAGIVEKVARGDDRGFHIVNPDATRDLLARFEPVPELLSNVHDIWEDLFSGHRKR